MVKAVVGANWGDEGKGKITDMLAKRRISSSVFRVERWFDCVASNMAAACVEQM